MYYAARLDVDMRARARNTLRALAAKSGVGIQNEVAFWLFCGGLRGDIPVSHFPSLPHPKNQKRILRRRSQDHFRVKKGVLFLLWSVHACQGLSGWSAHDAKSGIMRTPAQE